MGAAAPIMIAGSAAMSAVGSIKAGEERAAAARFEGQQQRQQLLERKEQLEFEQRELLFEKSRLEGEAEQLRINEETARIAADQAEAERRDSLTSTLETIQAYRAGRGVGDGSPTGLAILDALRSDAMTDIRTERYNFLATAEHNRRSAVNADAAALLRGEAADYRGIVAARTGLNAGLVLQVAERKAQSSLMSGYLGAAGSILKAGSSLAGSFGASSSGLPNSVAHRLY